MAKAAKKLRQALIMSVKARLPIDVGNLATAQQSSDAMQAILNLFGELGFKDIMATTRFGNMRAEIVIDPKPAKVDGARDTDYADTRAHAMSTLSEQEAQTDPPVPNFLKRGSKAFD